ncbi:MAG: phosphotransferase family protein [Rhodospirillales bacterium]|nr:phosphotransferase family protein [Rhodospirillales bacterium]
MEDRKEQLERFLAEAAGADRVAIAALERMPGGAIQDNWRADADIAGGPFAGRLEVVVRADPDAVPAVSHDRREEFFLLKAAHEAGVTVPEPLWLCDDPAVLGRPFFVMRRVRGVAAGHRIVKDYSLGGDRASLANRLGGELARIHSIRPPRPDLAFLKVPDEPPALEAVGDYRAHLDAHGEPRPALELGLEWLERNAPPAGDVVLCHRDFRTGNYMVDESGITGILDWEFADWGDPLEDVGWFCARCWRFGAVDRPAGGIGTRDAFCDGYEQVAGRTLERDRIGYWEVMAHMRWAVIALQQATRHLSGEQTSLELALTGHIVPELELQILDMTEEGVHA